MTNSSTDGNRFSQIPEEVLYSGVSDGAYRLYGALARIVDTRTWQGYALIGTLAKRLNRSESAVKRNLRELVAAKLIRSQKQWTDGKKYVTTPRDGWRQTSNLYTLHLNRGFKSEPPAKSEPRASGTNEPGEGVRSERGVGVRNDLQYDSPNTPEPIESINPVLEVPLSSAKNEFSGDEEKGVEGEPPASRRKTLADQREPMPEEVKAIIQETFLDKTA